MNAFDYFVGGCAAVAAVMVLFPYHAGFIAGGLFLMGVLAKRVAG